MGAIPLNELVQAASEQIGNDNPTELCVRAWISFEPHARLDSFSRLCEGLDRFRYHQDPFLARLRTTTSVGSTRHQ